MGGIINVSEPFLKEEQRKNTKLSYGILKLDGLELSIKPQTYKVGLLAFGPVFPIIPVGPGNDFDRQQNKFMVVMQLATNNSDVTFTPKSVILNYNGKLMNPIRYHGPINKNDYAREAARAVPGHKWICRPKIRLSEMTNNNMEKEQKIAGEVCIILEYPVITPEVDEPFNIMIKGIKNNGTSVDIPIIYFKPGKRPSYTIMG